MALFQMASNFLYASSESGKAQKKGRGRLEEGRQRAVAALRPYTQTAAIALDKLRALQADPSSIKDMPGYQFRFQEQQRAVQQGSSAVGKLFSGQTLVELLRRGGEFASAELDKEYNRLGSIANLGLMAAGKEAEVETSIATGKSSFDKAQLARIAQHEQGGIDIAGEWASPSTWFGGGGMGFGGKK